MNNARSSEPPQADKSTYEAMATAVDTNLAKLVTTFRSISDAEALLEVIRTDNIARRFIESAEEAFRSCSFECAKIMRHDTVLGEIRALPTASLADEVRKQVFASNDEIIQCLKELETALDQIILELEDDYDVRMETRRDLMCRMIEGNEVALRAVSGILAGAVDLIEPLLDYCFARCFGGQVSLECQQVVIELATARLEQELRPIIQMIHQLPEARKRVQEAQTARRQMTKAKATIYSQSILDSQKPNLRALIFGLTIMFGLGLWCFFSFKAVKSVESIDDLPIFSLMALAIMIGFCGFETMKFVRRP